MQPSYMHRDLQGRDYVKPTCERVTPCPHSTRLSQWLLGSSPTKQDVFVSTLALRKLRPGGIIIPVSDHVIWSLFPLGEVLMASILLMGK